MAADLAPEEVVAEAAVLPVGAEPEVPAAARARAPEPEPEEGLPAEFEAAGGLRAALTPTGSDRSLPQRF